LIIYIQNLFSPICYANSTNHIHRKASSTILINVLKNCTDEDFDQNFEVISVISDITGCFVPTKAGSLSISNGKLYLITNKFFYENNCSILFKVSDGDLDNPNYSIQKSIISYIDDKPYSWNEFFTFPDIWTG
jgi:hypothetical protein